jgi:hypothetical protein
VSKRVRNSKRTQCGCDYCLRYDKQMELWKDQEIADAIMVDPLEAEGAYAYGLADD